MMGFAGALCATLGWKPTRVATYMTSMSRPDRYRRRGGRPHPAVRQAETEPLMEDFNLWLDARVNLGVMYVPVRRSTQDNLRAYMWSNLAAFETWRRFQSASDQAPRCRCK